MLTGCGEDNSKTDATQATANTEATTAATEAATQTATKQADQAQSAETQAQPVSDGSYEFDEDGYIDQQTAIANVRQLVGTGAQVLDYYKGYSPDGIKAWVVTVAPVSTSDSAANLIYYSGYQFCYTVTTEVDDDAEGVNSDGYIEESVAIANVKQQAGSGAQILSCEKGYTPDGFEAWIITVAPVSASDTAETVTYYSGYQF